MHLITLFRVMNPHQRCLQAKVKYRNEPKQVLPKSEDPSRSLEINAIWTFDFTHVVCLLFYDIDYRYWICLLVL